MPSRDQNDLNRGLFRVGQGRKGSGIGIEGEGMGDRVLAKALNPQKCGSKPDPQAAEIARLPAKTNGYSSACSGPRQCSGQKSPNGDVRTSSSGVLPALSHP
jgi:hypothetical protein